MKAWLHRRCDLEDHQIVLCTDKCQARRINEVVASDCEVVLKQCDTVLLLQSADVLAEPRCLARLYCASANRVPIVPVLLTGSTSFQEWNFEESKKILSQLGGHINSEDVSSALSAATGASSSGVGLELVRTIPNVISKPLSVKGIDTEFEAQMCDIELTLRRDMAKVGKSTQPIEMPSDAPSPRSRHRKSAVVPIQPSEGIPATPTAELKTSKRSTTPPGSPQAMGA